MTATASSVLAGAMHTAWGGDSIAHILEHAGNDEPSGTWTGRACPDRGLPLGSDADAATLGDLCTGASGVADLTWEPPDSLARAHAWAFTAAMRAWHAGDAGDAEAHWDRLRALWSRVWLSNRAALDLLQDTGLERFAPFRPQQWVVASFEHHCSSHAALRPHVHNIVIPALTTRGP